MIMAMCVLASLVVFIARLHLAGVRMSPQEVFGALLFLGLAALFAAGILSA